MKKVLVVDDEESFCSSLKKSLELVGDFEVSTCSDARGAVGEAKKLQPDLILLDILMPGLSGAEVAEQLKRKDETKTIPVIYLTATVLAEETQENRNVIGGSYYVAKPVDMNELKRIINEATE